MIIFYLIYGFFSTYYFLKIFIPFLKKRVIDIPNKRSLHSNPKPTGGGIVFVIQILIISFFSRDYFPLICLPLSIIGFLDDKFNLSSKIRFTFQIFTSCLIIYFTQITINSVNLDITLPLNFIVLLLIIFTLTAFINFVNFMDGIDGIVASSILPGFLFIAIKNNPIIFIIVGSLLGFLKWNWSPSKIFMGDVGSTFLASYYLLSLFRLDNLNNIIGFFFVLSPLIFDSTFCVLRRLKNNQNIFQPHKLHLYQRLCQAGLSHSQVSIIYSLSCLILCITYISFGLYFLSGMVFIIITLGFWLDRNYAVSFKECLKSEI
ncbi:MraY family glycosyltransferase [Prochlorococcus marinus]|uniref:MraY family glycosyltransferase n=1 Tax=Prochlorococcus marinus TaxID=1219 RepID=UPI00094C2DCE|nr:glycosyltransferase family 4 protein [Prochlorococcus marinus]